MPELVEGDGGEPGSFQERQERTLSEVGGVDEVPDLAGEDEALVLVEATGLQLLGFFLSVLSPEPRSPTRLSA